jgi:hypothetical protein
MTAAVPSEVPSELIAGDTWVWTRDLADYLAPTWVATIYFEFAGSQFSQAATGSGSTHTFTIAAATTALKKAGRYRWWIRATDGSTITTIEEGWTDVKPDPAATGTRDHRSWARRTLDAIEATLEGKASADQSAMTINGRSISRIPLVELREWRNELRNEVRTEEQGADAGHGRDIKVRFKRA